MLNLTKVIMLILVAFLINSCGNKTVNIPKALTEPPKKPKPPKIKAKIKKPIAIFMIKQDASLDKCILKLRLIRELNPP